MAIHLVIATMMAQIEHPETTRPINKLRKQIRQGVQRYHRRHGTQKYDQLVEYANSIWESAKSDVDKDTFTVSLALALVISYDLLDTDYRNIWYTEKTFMKAVTGLEHGYEMEGNVERSSQWLIDQFSEAMGIPSKPKFTFKG